MSDTKYTPQLRYMEKAIRRINFSLNRNTDSDIIEHLESMGNVQGYLKGLVRADIAQKIKLAPFNCLACGEYVEPTSWQRTNHKSRVCVNCRNRGYRIRVCEVCGREFALNDGKRMRCSSCSGHNKESSKVEE